MIPNILLVLVSILFAFGRIAGMKGKIFQALAHLWIGGLIGAATINHSSFLLIQIISLSIVELFCFFVLKGPSEEIHTFD
jgi:hypothetical protein